MNHPFKEGDIVSNEILDIVCLVTRCFTDNKIHRFDLYVLKSQRGDGWMANEKFLSIRTDFWILHTENI